MPIPPIETIISCLNLNKMNFLRLQDTAETHTTFSEYVKQKKKVLVSLGKGLFNFCVLSCKLLFKYKLIYRVITKLGRVRTYLWYGCNFGSPWLGLWLRFGCLEPRFPIGRTTDKKEFESSRTRTRGLDVRQVKWNGPRRTDSRIRDLEEDELKISSFHVCHFGL